MYAAFLVIAILSTGYSRTGYCQLSEEAFNLLQDVEFKWSARWLSTACIKSWYVPMLHLYKVKRANMELNVAFYNIFGIFKNDDLPFIYVVQFTGRSNGGL